MGFQKSPPAGSDSALRASQGQSRLLEAHTSSPKTLVIELSLIHIYTETGFIKLGLAKELCKLMNGSYYAMDTITAVSYTHLIL